MIEWKVPERKEDVEISEYDKETLRGFSIEAAEDFIHWGVNGAGIDWLFTQAFRLGYTAVSRGESQQAHPPRPEWMTDDEVTA